MAQEYKYCPYCGIPLVAQHVFGNMRSVCPECGFVHFHDPKVAVIGLVTSCDSVLLIRRGVEPARGKWALPGGYMDAGEMPVEALKREILEEVGLEVNVAQSLGIYPLAKSSKIVGGIVIAYHATPENGDLPAVMHYDDADEAAWFTADTLPYEVAFDSSEYLLGLWKDGRLPSHPDCGRNLDDSINV